MVHAVTLRMWMLLLGLVLGWAVQGCASARPAPVLAAPVESTTVGPGDVIELEIVGEKDLPKEYQVASDGTVDFPYIQRVSVGGLEPQEIQALVREKLIAAQILTQPSVVVKIKAYNSKRVTVLGQVQKPGSFPLSPGLTLIQAISQAGGLNSIADKDDIRLTRKTKEGSRTVTVDVKAISQGTQPDIPLQAGDQIYVPERVF